ncbi:MAG TPA: MFS transporter, partial [Cryptosporangiaceae bacterium]|nr:MFS transporter [Cryptosporangiaceae bacterium]
MARPSAAPGRVDGALRATTAGTVLVVTLIAFEAIAVATALPTAVRALDGLAYYGWPFLAFLIANVLGMVLGGELSDRYGPTKPLVGGLLVFAGGLVVSGAAFGMVLFVAGRAVQGLGAGLVIVALYVVIGEAYAEDARPRVFGFVSAAWVLPALIGPVVAGWLAEHLSWRWVFLGIPPLVGLGLLLIVPGLRRLPPKPPVGRQRRTRWPYALLAGGGLATLLYAGQRHDLPAVG